MHGHRKIAAATATFGAGATLGKDLLIYFWNQTMVRFAGVEAMPEVVALEIVTLCSLLAFYITNEEPPEILMVPPEPEKTDA